MPATFYEGPRRSGKSLHVVSKIQEYLREGRRVATNLDLYLENLVPENPKASVTRLPDFPRSKDMYDIGTAYPELNVKDGSTYDENKNGLVVLDELLTSINSRNWNDKDRLKLIGWIVLSGKLGWDLIFIGQSFDACDTQLRDTVINRICRCNSTEHMFPGFIWNNIIKPWWIKKKGITYYVFFYNGKSTARENFSHRLKHKRYDLFNCYNTAQLFYKDVRIGIDAKGKEYEIDDRVIYSVIGKNYFPRTSESTISKGLELVHVKPTEVKKTKKKHFDFELPELLKPSYFFALGMVIFAYMYFTKPTSATVSQPQNYKTASSFKEPVQTVDIEQSELGKIFVNCSVHSTDGQYQYCFENENGHVVNPEDIGYLVLYVSECHAKLKRKNNIYDVYCNPVQRRYDQPSNEVDFSQYASNN